MLVSVDEGAGETAVEAARVKATELVDRARSGADFSALAETHSDDAGSARRGGDLGVIQSGTMPSSFEEAAVSLLEGQISDPIRTRYGFHVIQVTRLNEATLESYAEVSRPNRYRNQTAGSRVPICGDGRRPAQYQLRTAK